MTLETDCPVVVLTSGQTLRIRKVKLYEEEKVNEISLLRAGAAKSLGGVSTGIGFWGSPEWALGGATALGIVEGLLSSAVRKQAVEMIQAAQAKSEEIAKSAFLFETSQLSNTHIPYPEAWFATVMMETKEEREVVDITNWGSKERDDFLRKHNKTQQDIIIIGGKRTIRVDVPQRDVPQRYVHNNGEFVNVETDIGAMSIRWSHVVAYFPPQSTPPNSQLISQRP